MTMIRPATSDDEDRIAELSLQAWEPVFASMAATLGQPIFRQLFGADWRRYQEADVRRACSAYQVCVADTGEEVAGFTALHFPEDEPHGEIYMLAVHPQHQRQGIGADLTRFAVDQIRAAGRPLAIVNMGGDPGHAPARSTYERVGFTSLPSEQYFMIVAPGGDGDDRRRRPCAMKG